MTPKRLGALLFGSGLLLASLSAVAFGVAGGGTQVACGPDFDPSYALVGVELVPLYSLPDAPSVRPTVVYTDGCNDYWIADAVLAGGLTSLSGAVLALAGAARDL
jgi:hypothetical protein